MKPVNKYKNISRISFVFRNGLLFTKYIRSNNFIHAVGYDKVECNFKNKKTS